MSVTSGFRGAGLALAVIAGSLIPTSVLAQKPQPASSQPPIALTPQERAQCERIRDNIGFAQCIESLGVGAAQRARDAAIRDRDAANRDRDAANRDRDAANRDRDAANRDRDAANRDRDRDAANRDRDSAQQRIQSNNKTMECLRRVVEARDARRIPDPGQLTPQNVCAIAQQYRLG